MRKYLFVLLCGLLSLQTFAEPFQVGYLKYDVLSDSTVEVAYTGIDFTAFGSNRKCVIPETVEYDSKVYTVVGLHVSAFDGEYIGAHAFDTVVIPASVTTIGQYAFWDQESLKCVIFADGSKLKTIVSSAFNRCYNIVSLCIPSTVAEIGDDAFYDVPVVVYAGNATGSPWGADVICAANDDNFAYADADMTIIVKYIGSGADVTIPAKVKEISAYAFSGCGLSALTVPSTVAKIEYDAFNGVDEVIYTGNATGSPWGARLVCAAKDDNFAYADAAKTIIARYIGTDRKVVIPEGVKEIGESAFDGDYIGFHVFDTVVIPASVTTLGQYAFYEQNDLKKVIFADGSKLTTIEESAFCCCYNIDSLCIPSTVAEIGDGAFAGVDEVIYTGTAQDGYPWGAGLVYAVKDDNFIYADAAKTIIAQYIGNGGKVVIPEGVKNIYNKAFFSFGSWGGKSVVDTVVLPNSLESIGDEAFCYCNKLKVEFGNNSKLASIGSYAFANCFALDTLVLPESLVAIGDYAFDQCGSKSVSFGNNSKLASIGYYAFNSCGFDTIVLPSSLKTIKDNAFRSCSDLKSVTFANDSKLLSIGSYAFYDSPIDTLRVPAGVEEIGDYAFDEVNVLVYAGNAYVDNNWGANNWYPYVEGDFVYADATKTVVSRYIGNGGKVVIPEGVKVIGESAFDEERIGNILDTVVIPASVTTIEMYGFWGQTGLKELIFADGSKLTSIGGASFGRIAVDTLSLPESLVTIGEDAFYQCSNIDVISIPATVAFIGNGAFLEVNTIVYAGNANDNNGNKWGASNWYVNVEGDFIFDDAEKTILSGYVGTDNVVAIPSTVVRIADYVFMDKDFIDTVFIPNSVTYIGYQVFDGCSSLQFKEDGRLLYLGNAENEYYALVGATKDSSTYNINERTKVICAGALEYKTIFSIVIPDSVLTIGDGAFQGCYALDSLVIGKSVATIGNSAFQNCSQLDSVCFPESVAVIGTDAFNSCPIDTVIITNPNITIGLNAFSSDEAYNEYDNAYYIGVGDNKYHTLVKAKSQSIESCAINPDTKVILEQAFYGCYNLGSIVIPNSVESIGQYAFVDCSDMDTVVIGESVSSIGEGAFIGSGVKSLTFGKSLAAIGKSVFAYCNYLKSVTIPNTVKTIGDNAFYDCYSLQTVNFGNSVETIGEMAFYECASLKYAILPNSLKTIGDYAFGFCSSLELVAFGNSVKTIGEYAFAECSALTTVTIPNSVQTIGKGAFLYDNGIRLATVPATVEYVGNGAFEEVQAVEYAGTLYNAPWDAYYWYASRDKDFLYMDAAKTQLVGYVGEDENVVIPNTVTNICSEAFAGNSNLKSVTIPNSVKRIGSYAFGDCYNLDLVYVPKGVEYIGSQAFYDVYAIAYDGDATGRNWGAQYVYSTCDDFLYTDESKTVIGKYIGKGGKVVVPEGVQAILVGAFQDNTAVTSVELPSTLQYVGYHVFDGCSNISLLEVPSSVGSIDTRAFGNVRCIVYDGYASFDHWSDANWGAQMMLSSAVVDGDFIYSDESKKNLVLYIGNDKNVVIPDSVVMIGDNAFQNCSFITSVQLPDSLEYIGYNSFRNCTGLTSVVIPDSVTYVARDAFHGCSGLTSIVIGKNVEFIGGGAFEDCTGLAELVIPDSVNQIDMNAFKGCTGLVSLVIGNGITDISYGVFENCTGLKSITLSDSLKTIGQNAFRNCSSLTNVVIPDSVVSVGQDAFHDCSGITNLALGQKLETIGDGAFENCTGIKTLVITDSVQYVGVNAFRGCTGMESLTIGVNVAEIAGNGFWGGAFSNCTNLKTVVMNDTVGYVSIGERAFEGCNSLDSINVPSNVESIGNNAFANVNNVVYNGSASGNWGCATTNGVVCGDFLYYNENKLEVALYIGKDADVVIPDSVVYIGPDAFSGLGANLKSVVLPDSLLYIDDNAFEGCSSLTTLVIPEKVYHIGNYAFHNCLSLDSVVMNDTISGYDVSIGEHAFDGCGKLISVDMPSNVYSIGRQAFAWVKNINYTGSAYYESDDYIWGAVTLNGYVEDDFIYFDEDRTAIALYIGTEKNVVIPDSVYYIGDNAFRYNDNITSVTMGNSVKYIGNWAFSECENLSSVVLGDSLLEIGNFAFLYSGKIISLDIPETVYSFGVNPFGWGVKNVNYNGPVTGDWGCVSVNGVVDGDYIYFDESKHMIALYIGTDSEVSIPDSVVYIGPNAFRDNDFITAVSIPESVQIMGNDVFAGCDNVSIYNRSEYEQVGWADNWNPDNRGVVDGCVEVKVLANNSNYGRTKGARFVARGSQITISATPAEGYHLKQWDNGVRVATRNVNIVSDTTFRVTFESHTIIVDSAVAATCTMTGLTEGSHCSFCGEVLVEQLVVEAHGHDVVVDDSVAPTCTLTGLTEGKHCSVCDSVFVKQEVIAALGHKEVVDDSVAATCTKTGLTEGKHCSVCDSILVAQKVVPALGHKEVVDAAVATTCTKTGLTEGKHCSVCDSILVAQNVVAALGHNVVDDAAVAATCSKTGLTAGKHCSLCDSVFVMQEVVAALGHKVVADSAVAATCSHIGLTAGSHCSVCDSVLVKQNVIAALPHTVVEDTAVAATCTYTGLTAGQHCSVCDSVLVAQTVIPLVDHKFTNYIYNEDATFDADGTETAFCDYGCGASDTREAAGTKLTSVDEYAANAVEIHAHNNVIVVNNADAQIFVFDATGRCIESREADASVEIAVQRSGIYIVRVGNLSQRVALVF